MVAGVELPINRFASANAMAETIFGDGVTIVDATYSGSTNSSGIYSNGDAIAPGYLPSDTGVMFSTGDLRSFTNDNASQSNLSGSTTSRSSGENNNPDFNAQAGTSTFDASYLDVDFIPTGDTMALQLVFASEEYPEFTNSVFQDFVGVWVNGSFVELSVGDGDVDPGNLNSGSNQNLFQDNTGDQFNTEMDGITVVLQLVMDVVPNAVNSIRIGIADVADDQYDSTLIIAADSVQTSFIANDDSVTVAPDGSRTVDVLANDENATGGTLTITHINGQAVTAGSVVTLSSGQQVQLNGDGTITVIGDGDEETVNFTYTAESSTGPTSTAIVTLDSVPCFVAGTRIATERGNIPIETLEPGDMVFTKDDGVQPLRWIGQRRVVATGDHAPIRIKAGTFGDHGEIRVSPLHRILIRDYLAELLFAEEEVLVAARDLVNDSTITREEGGEVTYVHILFDRHQIVVTEGLETESFLPGPQMKSSFEEDMIEEITTLFPELCPLTGKGYSKAARQMLKRFEAQLIAHKWAA
jgi:hypothetical protein